MFFIKHSFKAKILRLGKPGDKERTSFHSVIGLLLKLSSVREVSGCVSLVMFVILLVVACNTLKNKKNEFFEEFQSNI